MGGKNNTTPIGDGSIGINTEDGVSREIQREVSENNLKYQIGQNSSVKGVFNATLRMVERWMTGDKFRILQEYGAIEKVSKNPSSDELNQAVATVLIANLPKDELKRIIGTEEAKQNKLTKDVQSANAKSVALGKKYFNLGSAKQFVDQTSQNVANPNQALKLIQAQDKDFKVDKAFTKKYPALMKELSALIRGFTKAKIAEYMQRLDLESDEVLSIKEASDMISNKVVMYVSLIIGNAKGISPSQFSPDEVEAIEELLQMTSWGWVTGKVGLGSIEVANKRKKAFLAKKQLIQNKKIASQNSKLIGEKKISLFHKGEKKLKKGVLPISAKRDALNNEKEKAFEFLDSFSEADLRALAITKGIEDADDISVESLKEQLATVMAAENYNILKQKQKALKIRDPKKREEAMKTIADAKNSSLVGAAKKMANTADQEYSEKIPVVTFNQDGKLASEGILKAVPVFIAGSADKVGKIQSKAEAQMIRESDNLGINKDIDDYFDLVQSRNSWMDNKITNAENSRNYENNFLSKSNLSKTRDKNEEKHYQDMTVATGRIISNVIPNVSSTGDIKYSPSAIDSQTTHKDIATYNQLAGTRSRTSKAKKSFTVAQLKGRTSYLAQDAFAKLRLDSNEATKVIPVIDLNRSHDYGSSIYDATKKSASALKSIDYNLSKFLTTGLASLQMGGTSFNSAAIGAGTILAEQLADTFADIPLAPLTMDTPQMATGGSMRGRNFISSVITGDHPNNKNNTELVSVDWQNKNINVKPIPKMAKGGNVLNKSSNVDKIQRLTAGERNKPLSVGISSGVVYYSRQLSDVEDDNTKTAIKVYSVNNGIQDKIKVGDSEISLFDAVYGIYTSVAALNEGIAQSNQLLSNISANTSITNKKISSISSNSSGSPFEFTNELNTILSGD